MGFEPMKLTQGILSASPLTTRELLLGLETVGDGAHIVFAVGFKRT